MKGRQASVVGRIFLAALALAVPAGAGNLLLMSSFDSRADVTSPPFGTGDGASVSTAPVDDFVPAFLADGLRCDAIGERASFRQTDGTIRNVDLERGTVDFMYLPFYDHDDGLKYTLFGTGPWQSPGSLHLGKHNWSNDNALFIIFFDLVGGLHQNNVAVGDYSWQADEWIRVRVTWDFAVADGDRNVHVYLNDVEVPITTTPNGPPTTGPFLIPEETTDSFLYVGSRDATGTIIPSGVHDELRVWDAPIPPGEIFLDGFESGDLSRW